MCIYQNCVHGSLTFSRQPITVTDRDGKLVAVVIPSGLSSRECTRVHKLLSNLQPLVDKKSGRHRGNFDVITHGFQWGPGTAVRSGTQLFDDAYEKCSILTDTLSQSYRKSNQRSSLKINP